MAYSDYGGYAYKNGKRVEDRSDAMITPKMESVPGQWPGFAAYSQGLSKEKFYEIRPDFPNGHVVIGDDPVYVGLYKQGIMMLWFGTIQLDKTDFIRGEAKMFIKTRDNGYKFLDRHTVANTYDTPIFFDLPDGYKLYGSWKNIDNYYVFARLEMPNGDIWHGWSGYGVGAGLEDANYGYSTRKVEGYMKDIWPDCYKKSEGT